MLFLATGIFQGCATTFSPHSKDACTPQLLKELCGKTHFGTTLKIASCWRGWPLQCRHNSAWNFLVEDDNWSENLVCPLPVKRRNLLQHLQASALIPCTENLVAHLGFLIWCSWLRSKTRVDLHSNHLFRAQESITKHRGHVVQTQCTQQMPFCPSADALYINCSFCQLGHPLANTNHIFPSYL